jgi:hypothetical protein
MQISKSFLALCATVACVAPLVASGVDTEAQAKARAALEQKLDELQSQDALRPKPAAPTPKAKAVKKQKAAKAPVAQAPAQPAAACCASTPAAKTTEQPTTPVVASAPAPKAPAPKATTAAVAQPATAYHFATVSADASSDPDSVAKARQALWQEMDQLNQAKPAPAPVPVQAAPAKTAKTEVAQSTVSPAPKAKVAAKRVLTYQPIERPVSPLSADKEQRLSELLQQYKADQITPEQYQTQRAKILAEP